LGLFFALLVGLSSGWLGLISGLFVGLLFGRLVVLSFGRLVLISGLLFGLFGGLEFGGGAVIQHFILRFTLYRADYLPWDLTRFLDYAADRIFLRRVGGGYIFVHRMLQDYFASLYQGD